MRRGVCCLLFLMAGVLEGIIISSISGVFRSFGLIWWVVLLSCCRCCCLSNTTTTFLGWFVAGCVVITEKSKLILLSKPFILLCRNLIVPICMFITMTYANGIMSTFNAPIRLIIMCLKKL
ncbi:hypothetical protein B0T13DRAFT_83006 [Neurospora crassa]|nr:hypothetical protein B0T13DRAFT_83006 [Neurospora crassa]